MTTTTTLYNISSCVNFLVESMGLVSLQLVLLYTSFLDSNIACMSL